MKGSDIVVVLLGVFAIVLLSKVLFNSWIYLRAFYFFINVIKLKGMQQKVCTWMNKLNFSRYFIGAGLTFSYEINS
jgi:hypothetical protein